MNHSLLPSIPNATLPQKYEAAKLAISQCARADECKDWSDKAQAAASYARQAGDKEMEKMALRIRLRAERRLGQLYEELEKSSGGRPSKTGDSKSPVFGKTRTDLADEIGQTKDQMKRSVRAARVPEESFEKQTQSDKPPTITSLAEQGMAKGIPRYEQLGMTKKAFQAGMYFQGRLADMAKQIKDFDPQDVVDGSTPEERKQIRKHIETIDNYFDQLIVKL